MEVKPLNIIQLNVNSIRSIAKRQELNTFIKSEKPHIILLNETKLNNKHKVEFTNYNFIRTDRPNNNGGGGTGIVIHESLSYTVLSIPALNSIECTAIKIPLNNNKYLIIATVYVAKSMQNTIDTGDLNKILNLKNYDSDIIMGGDFNAHHPLWLSDNTSPNGRALYKWYVDNFSTQSISLNSTLHPSRHCNDTHSYLDLFFVGSGITVLYPMGFSNHLKTIPFESDHDAVLLSILLNASIIQAEPMLVSNYALTNWKKFNKKIDDGILGMHIPNNLNINNQEIDALLLNITELLQNTIEEEVPKTTIKNIGQIPLPKHILLIIKYKNKLRKIWHRKHYRHTDLTISSQIKCLNIIIKNLIGNHYNDYYKTKLSSIKPDNNLYKNLKKFAGFKIREKFTTVLKSSDDVIFSSVQEKANGIGCHFENVHKRTLSQGDASFSEAINRIIDHDMSSNNCLTYFSAEKTADQNISPFHPFQNNLDTPPTQIQQTLQIPGKINLLKNNTHYMSFASANEIIAIVNNKNSKKSFGSDGISNFVLRKLSFNFYHTISILFNHIFNNAYWPENWKNGTIIPILKPAKDPIRVDSYRPITLLSCLSKIFESWVLTKIRTHCDDNNIIPDEQFGFRPQRSTVQALTKLSHDITTAINEGVPTIACSIDCEKAFDTTWIEGLIYKLKYLFGFNNHLCKLLYSYLKNRTFQVKIENTFSDSFKIVAGVPQGSVLAPVLYTLFIADIPAPNCNEIKKLIFADDIFVYLSTRSLLGTNFNNYLSTIHDHLNLWKIKINLDKCEGIVFKGNCKSLPRWVNKKVKNVQIKIKTHKVNVKNKIKYLGIIFSKNLKFHDHVQHIINKSFKAFHKIKHIFYRKNKYSTMVKSILYKQLLRPIITYGFLIWHNISSAQMERLRTLERKFLRMCISSSRKTDSFLYINNNKLYDQTNTPRLDRNMVEQALKTLAKFNTCDISLINDTLNEHDDGYYLNIDNIFKSPIHLKTLSNNNKLYDNNHNLIYYHRRNNNVANNHDEYVYNINQNIM